MPRLVHRATGAVGGWTRTFVRALRIITPLGWVAFAGGAVLLILGLAGGWVELVAAALVLLVPAVVAVVWTLGRIDYDTTISVDRHRVQVGDELLGVVRVTNRAQRQLPGASIEVPVGRNVAQFDLPSLGHEDTHEQVFVVPTRRRSVIVLGPARTVRTDPLTLIRRDRTCSEAIEVFVHSKTVPIGSNLTGFLKDVEGITTHDLSSSDVAFHALRDYVPGDDRRAIHWRTTARLNKFMVRQFEETKRTHLLVVLSLVAAHYETEDDFETAISCAASLVLQALREDRQVSLITDQGTLAVKGGVVVLDELSRVEASETDTALYHLSADAVTKVPDCSVAALVTGANVEARDLRRSRNAVPLDVSTFVLRCAASAGAPGRRALGDLVVLDIPALNDLPRAIRSLR